MMESEWSTPTAGSMFILRSSDEVEYSKNVAMSIQERSIYRIYNFKKTAIFKSSSWCIPVVNHLIKVMKLLKGVDFYTRTIV